MGQEGERSELQSVARISNLLGMRTTALQLLIWLVAFGAAMYLGPVIWRETRCWFGWHLRIDDLACELCGERDERLWVEATVEEPE